MAVSDRELQITHHELFSAVYGPVKSWRYGRSLGIDPIGRISTCSFNCIYCQLGDIQVKTRQRQIFVPTSRILEELQAVRRWEDVDVVTLSGSGEPTLALNLGAILATAKAVARKPTVVLTNSSLLLSNPEVRSALAGADIVAAKLDAVFADRWQRINRAVAGLDLCDILVGIEQLRQEYRGYLAIQTMVVFPWTSDFIADYIRILKRSQPDEVQLNIPSRPRTLSRQVTARGNDPISPAQPVQQLRCVSADFLQALADEIHAATRIPVRIPPVLAHK
jgi:wyosine [tRNA(Phe)-imidazoG37] synthetase (radical SAM superfamily)